MKPLSIEGQIQILENVLHSPSVYGMCVLIAKYSGYSYHDRDFNAGKFNTQF